MSTDSDQHVGGQSKLEQALAAVQAGDLDSGKSPFKSRLPVDVLISVCAHDVSIDTED